MNGILVLEATFFSFFGDDEIPSQHKRLLTNTLYLNLYLSGDFNIPLRFHWIHHVLDRLSCSIKKKAQASTRNFSLFGKWIHRNVCAGICISNVPSNQWSQNQRMFFGARHYKIRNFWNKIERQAMPWLSWKAWVFFGGGQPNSSIFHHSLKLGFLEESPTTVFLHHPDHWPAGRSSRNVLFTAPMEVPMLFPLESLESDGLAHAEGQHFVGHVLSGWG